MNSTKIDNTLKKIIETNIDENLTDLRESYLSEVLIWVNLQEKKSIENSLFNKRNSAGTNHKIAVCLLRLLCSSQNAFWDLGPSFRHKAIDLIEEHLDFVCLMCQLEKNEKIHEKVSKLIDVEQRILGQFTHIKDAMSSIETVISSQNRFMQTLHKKPHDQFLSPFLDNRLLNDERIKELFDSVKNYDESIGQNRIKCFNQFKNIYKRYIKDAGKNPSEFTRYCLLDFLDKIFEIIKDDISTTDVIQPANLDIKEAKKKYPLHEEGRKVNLTLIVKNTGKGQAQDVELIITKHTAFEPDSKILNLPDIEPGEREIVIPVKILTSNANNRTLDIVLNWKNFDGTEKSISAFLKFQGQQANLDWNLLSSRKPYVMEAIEKEDELVGREQLIKALYDNVTSGHVESKIIWGQKRVGKTSIAKTLQTKLMQREDCSATYTLTNQLDKTSSDSFIVGLGKSIVKQLRANPLLVNLEDLKDVEFRKALAPLFEVFDTIFDLHSDLRLVIIIDEFDELPEDLISHTPENDTFFGNLRGLSTLPNVGFILVGGENMADIKERVARDSRLNKFVNHQVDYFDSGSGWQDFRNLVQYPVEDILEYSDESFQTLFNLTEGNPFFTKLICKNLYALKCKARDAYVTRDDIEQALRYTLNDLSASQVTLDSNNMGHFWTDAIPYHDQKNMNRRDEVETQRRRFLLAFADVKRKKNLVRKEDLLDSEYIESIPSSKKMIRSFEERGILVKEDKSYRLKPRLLEKWLIESGMRQLSMGYHDEQAVLSLVEKRELEYVKEEEIQTVTKNWGAYQGRIISVSDVRLWLDQFERPREQRLMFKLLKHLRFKDTLQMREAVRVINSRVKTQREIKQGEQRRRDILLSAFGGIGKSGSTIARIYGQENKILSNLIVEIDNLKTTLEKNPRIRAIVFVDDIIGSGKQTITAIEKISAQLETYLQEKNIQTYVTAICGLESGIEKVVQKIKKENYKIEVYTVDVFNESDQCFSESSEIFGSELEREEAKEIAQIYGSKLVRDMALGFEDSQLLVTFADQCPNNTLPIFWSDANGWEPLFKRK